MKKPNLSFWDIWNMSFGFLGIQFGFALQNTNASRILQILGADVHNLSLFWLVAPLTGMIVQPIIGHFSDKTWTKLGRRRPYFLIGAIVASIGLIIMPNAGMFTAILPALWVGAGMMMIMDASFNVAMEPFRALVADKLNTEQRTEGFAIQTVLIGVGAVIGSALPYILDKWFGISKNAAEGVIPMNVILSFVIGAAVLILTIVWTVIKTKEYSPEEVDQFIIEDQEVEVSLKDQSSEKSDKSFITSIIRDFIAMPNTMKQLGFVQFCSWFALFGMWVYTTQAIAQHVYGLPVNDSSSEAYQEAGNWTGILFGTYNLVSAIYAFALPKIAKNIGRKNTHSLSLVLGGVGFISIYFIGNPMFLILPMVGIGIAWASILAMPYAILAGSIPLKKMGIYMGIFNFFITIPQIVSALVIGPILLKYAFNNHAIYVLIASGVFFILGAIATQFVEDKDDIVVA